MENSEEKSREGVNRPGYCSFLGMTLDEAFVVARAGIKRHCEELEAAGLPVWTWRDGRVVDATGRHKSSSEQSEDSDDPPPGVIPAD